MYILEGILKGTFYVSICNKCNSAQYAIKIKEIL